MKVFAISRDNQFYKIGNDFNSAVWYQIGENQENISTVSKGDEVDIESKVENGKKVLTKVVVTNKATTSNYNDRNTSIEKQAMMKSAADAIKTMTGQFPNVDDLGDAILKLYEKLYRKLGE